jgi:hypothetical protein
MGIVAARRTSAQGLPARHRNIRELQIYRRLLQQTVSAR